MTAGSSAGLSLSSVIGCVGGMRRAHGPYKTIYNRFIRWSQMGVFNIIFLVLAAKGGRLDQSVIDATHLIVHRTVASILKKGLFPDVSDAPETG